MGSEGWRPWWARTKSLVEVTRLHDLQTVRQRRTAFGRRRTRISQMMISSGRYVRLSAGCSFGSSNKMGQTGEEKEK